MQSITSFKSLNLKPTIVVSHETLQAIKHIVSIAPQEAQWFHTVEAVEYKSSPGEIFLNLSPKLYIPKQNTSATQVDSNSSMMIEFYQELKQDYQDQAVVNEKLNSMTCWCHSHHNMQPSPSTQDNLQFNNFINSAVDQNQSSWQIMLIFNKKDKFYSRVWDPSTGMVFEGVDIHVSTPYDFAYIDRAAKEKFIKPTVKSFKNFNHKTFSSKGKFSQNHLIDDFLSSIDTGSYPVEEDHLNDSVATDLIDRIYSKFCPDTQSHSFKLITSVKAPLEEIYQNLITFLDDQEALWLSFILDNKIPNLKNLYSDTQVESYMSRYSNKIDERILNYLSNTNDTISCFHKKLSFLFSLTDSADKKAFLHAINNTTF